MGSVDQIIEIHGKLQSGRGRRHEQDALHKAGVVMTVAAWQSYIEKVVLEAMDVIGTHFDDPANPAPAWAKSGYLMRRATILQDIKRFNTPNDVNVRDLFMNAIAFNPWLTWEWRQGRRQWNALEVRNRTNTWVLARHSVAHAFPLPDNVPWLRGANGDPRLTLTLLKECHAHFSYLAARTDASLSQHLAANHAIPAPW